MKHIDISESVMQRIASSEQAQVKNIKRRYTVMYGGLILLFVAIAAYIIFVLYEQQTFDLLTVFGEDWEVVSTYWQDTVLSFMQELPEPETIIAGVVLCSTLGSVILTRKIRQKLMRKEHEIQKYTKRARR